MSRYKHLKFVQSRLALLVPKSTLPYYEVDKMCDEYIKFALNYIDSASYRKYTDSIHIPDTHRDIEFF